MTAANDTRATRWVSASDRSPSRTGRRARPAARWLVALALAWCNVASSVGNGIPLQDLQRRSWGTVDGVPDSITAVVQTIDGFLWLASFEGLVRFDGLRFQSVDLPRDERISSVNIIALHASSSGGLWIGFTFGGVGLLKDGKLSFYGEAEGLPAGSVRSLAEDRDGTLWAGTPTGLARLENGRWRRVGTDEGLAQARVDLLFVDSAGALWVAGPGTLYRRSANDSRFRTVGTTTKAPRFGLLGIAEAPDGAVWASIEQGFVQQVAQNPPTGRPHRSSNNAMVFDRDGNLWSYQARGPARVAADRLRNATRIAANDPRVEVATGGEIGVDDQEWARGGALEDREGNLWCFGVAQIMRVAERNVEPIDPGVKPALDASFAVVAGDGGSLWIAGRFAAPQEIRAGAVVRRVPEIRGASSSLRADDGSLWFGNVEGVWTDDGDGFRRVALPGGIDTFDVQAMARDRSGTLWVSIVRNGVHALRGRQWIAFGGLDALPRSTAVSIATDAKGRVWFGYADHRVAVVDEGRVTVYDIREANIGNVTAIYGGRSHVWIGGEFGIARLDANAFRAVRPAAGLAFTHVSGLVEDPAGDLWINATRGIVHLAAADLRAATGPDALVRGEMFDAADGVTGSSARLRPLPTMAESQEGRLWFVRSNGLFAIDPGRIHRNPSAPPVVLQAVAVGSAIYPASERLELPAKTTSLRIDYVAPSLTAAEKVRYRYKLDGIDDGWQDVLGRRQAFYANLGPGVHRFHVIASNNDGVWNDVGAAMDIVIAPTFVQTKAFIALCVAAAALLVWGALRFRERRVAARLRLRFSERMAERERIARELHDTLLQSTQGLILRFQAVANRIARDDPLRDMLDQALVSADEVMTEGRDRLLVLRRSTDLTSDLAESLATIGGEFVRGSEVRFTVQVEGESRPLRPGVLEEAYRIGREALLNAVRHAHAHVIEVQVAFGDSELKVNVRDDGAGVDASTLEARVLEGHWGVKGMRERASRLGGQLDIWSADGAGTEIALTIPAAAAYLDARRRQGWRPMRRRGGVEA